MRIGLDANAVCGVGSKNRGIGNYCTDMIEALVRGFPEDEFFLLNCCENAPFGHGISGLPNFHEEFHYIAPAAALHCGEAATELTGEVVRSFVAANRLDAFLVTSPFDTFYPTYSREWFGDIPVAAIVYDIIPYVFQKRYLGDPAALRR